jgi:predicted dehydrogenase
MKFRLAIIGLGAAAQGIHLPACRQLPEVEVVGGCDVVAPERRFPFPVYDSLDKMLAELRPDILTIASPPQSHFELTRLALRAGCHVFCEKPFVSTLAEADEIIALSRARNRAVVVNNQFRFIRTHAIAREWIGKPEFGELRFLRAEQTFVVNDATEAGWRGADPQRTCKDFGIHALDLCRFFFGEDPWAITARMPRPGGLGGPDLLNLLVLEFSGDRVAVIVLDRLCRGRNSYLDLRLDGSEAAIETSIGGRIELRVGASGTPLRFYSHFDAVLGGKADLVRDGRSRRLATAPRNVFADATKQLLKAMLAALQRGETPPCCAEDNVRTLALMLAAYESAEKRATIPMTYTCHEGQRP